MSRGRFWLELIRTRAKVGGKAFLTKMTSSGAVPLAEWTGGPNAQRAFMEYWEREIASNDPVGSAEVGHDVHKYLERKVAQVVTTKRSIGMFGHAFLRELAGHSYMHCICYSDGASSTSQEEPYKGPSYKQEQWWPCITTVATTFPEVYSMYCPALAWQGSRPWGVHLSRIRRVEAEHRSFEPERPLRIDGVHTLERNRAARPLEDNKNEAAAQPEPEEEPSKV